MRLFLFRHAQSQNNALPLHLRVEDPGLTDMGIQQARYLARRAGQLGLTRLITSPFRRTLHTALPIYQETGLIPEVRIALHEQGGCYRGHVPGNLEGRPGMTRREIEVEYPGFLIPGHLADLGWWDNRSPETPEAATRRAAALVRETFDEFVDTDERVAYVMHGDFNRLFLQQFHFDPLEVPWNASVTTVEMAVGTFRLDEYNGVQHLPEELLTR